MLDADIEASACARNSTASYVYVYDVDISRNPIAKVPTWCADTISTIYRIDDISDISTIYRVIDPPRVRNDYD